MNAIVRGTLVLGFVLLASACGGGDDASSSGSDPKAKYGPTSRDTVSSYLRTSQSETVSIETRVVGEKTIAGKSYWRARIGTFSSAPSGAEAWLTQPNPDTLVVAGGEFYSQNLLPNPTAGEPSATVELETPVTVKLAPPLGTPQSLTLSTTITVLGQPLAVDLTGSYTMTSDDETVETLAGTLYGCRKLTGSASTTNTTLAGLLGDDTISGEVWYHPALGVLKATVTLPGKGSYDFDFYGTQEMGAAASGSNRIQAMGLLKTNETFRLDTFDVNGALDADKNTHAKMLLEVRFADEARAKSSDTPPVETEMGTALGIYPHQLTSSPVSFFHPEENGRGLTFWIAYVDQAAKNAPNDTAYHVEVTVPDYGSSAVRFTSRIVYTLAK